MLEKFGRYDDVDVNVLMSDEDKENLEPLSKREDRRGSLYCKSLPVCSTVTTIHVQPQAQCPLHEFLCLTMPCKALSNAFYANTS